MTYFLGADSLHNPIGYFSQQVINDDVICYFISRIVSTISAETCGE